MRFLARPMRGVFAHTRLPVRPILATAALTALVLLGPAAQAAGTPSRAATPVYLIESNGNSGKNLAAKVAAAGGTLERDFAEIGLVSASSADPDFAATLATLGLGRVQQDLPVKLVPDVLESGVTIQQVSASPLEDNEPGGAFPTSAFFYACQWNMKQANLPGAWYQGQFGNSQVKVAVLDSGIDPDHQELQGKVDLVNSASFLSPGTSPCNALLNLPDEESFLDFNFHGSFVSAIIATNNVIVAGAAPETEIVAIKVLACDGFGFFSDWIAGVMYAASLPDVHVINMSIGGAFSKSGSGAGLRNAAFNRAVAHAQSRGKLVVSSAGNDGVNLDKTGNIVYVPGQSGGGIATWAGDMNGNLASYSNYGRTGAWVGAGGGDLIPNTSPLSGCFLHPGLQTGIIGVCSSWSVLSPVCRLSIDFYVFGATGTSFSAPLVSGVAALIDGKERGKLGPGRLKTILKNTADDLGKAGVDPLFSHGRVNAGRALE